MHRPPGAGRNRMLIPRGLYCEMGSSLPCSTARLLPAHPRLLPAHPRLGLHPRGPWVPLVLPRSSRRRRRAFSLFAGAAAANAEKNLGLSWIRPEDDGYGGWSAPQPEAGDKKGCFKVLLAGVGTSVALLVAAVVIASKGLKFQFNAPFHALHKQLISFKYTEFLRREKEPMKLENDQFSDAKVEDKHDVAFNGSRSLEDDVSAMRENIRITVPVAADSTQQEALLVLKKLKIMENDISANELCTRREYARWLVKANSLFERNPKYRIVPSLLSASSMVTAFDDVSIDDPDYWCIQALGEAGIIPSKLSANSLSDDGSSDGQIRYDFHPESFISRFDMVNWKTLLEYPFDSEMGEKMLRTTVGFLDLSAINLDASSQLLIDLMAGDKSITRRVFGNIRRLQPHKPATKAQAAVSLTSGRMAEAIRTELSRLEAENQSRLAEMEEIRSELISRGDIQKFWEEKLKKERDRGFEVERNFHVAFIDIELEKVALYETRAKYMKEKAALECQQQLLCSLQKEIEDMSVRLAIEKASFMAEQQNLEKLLVELHEKQDAIFKTKSILEAEKEALRILRSWVEEEASRTQARNKILEGAVQRWNWSDKFGISQTSSPENGNSHEP